MPGLGRSSGSSPAPGPACGTLAPVWLTYSFLVLWIGGGLVLLAMLALRTTHRPYPFALAALGYGLVGFLCTGLGVTPRLMPLLAALGGALAGMALGWLLQRAFRPRPGLPLDVQS